MKRGARHLDQQFQAFRSLDRVKRPAKGWIRAVRDALGMSTSQFARRLGIAQSSASELEQAEARGGITLKRLERAAEALGCRVVYVLIPDKPLAQTLQEHAERVAGRELAAVAHTMRLEDQAVHDTEANADLHRRTVEALLQNPSRLWDEP
jgi:predicted DNA-binding mobile mystery protein A